MQASVAPKVRHSIAQGETLGFENTQRIAALKGRHSGGLPGIIGNVRIIRSGEWRPVGADRSYSRIHPGFRSAPPWAIEYDPWAIEYDPFRVEKRRTNSKARDPRLRQTEGDLGGTSTGFSLEQFVEAIA